MGVNYSALFVSSHAFIPSFDMILDTKQRIRILIIMQATTRSPNRYVCLKRLALWPGINVVIHFTFFISTLDLCFFLRIIFSVTPVICGII